PEGSSRRRCISIRYRLRPRVWWAPEVVKALHAICGKQMKCPVAVANEVSGLRVWAEIKGHLMRRYEDAALSGPSTGAGNEDTGSDFAGSQWKDFVDASGRDFGDFASQHAAVEAALRGGRL